MHTCLSFSVSRSVDPSEGFTMKERFKRSRSLKQRDVLECSLETKKRNIKKIKGQDDQTFESLSKHISVLSQKLHNSAHIDEFQTTVKSLWDSLVSLRLERKLVTQYMSAEATKSRRESESEWIATSFRALLEYLMSCVSDGTLMFAMESLDYLMTAIQVEYTIRSQKSTGHTAFPLRLLDTILKRCIVAPRCAFLSLVEKLTEKYIWPFVDLRFHFLQSIERVLVELLENPSVLTSSSTSCQSQEQISHHLFALLYSFPNPQQAENGSQGLGTRWFCDDPISSQNGIDAQAYKNVFINCWIRYLRLDTENLKMSIDLYREILTLLPTHVLPFLASPLLVSKFFFNAFYHNDLSVAVDALSGLFYLLVKAHLAEPQLLDSTGKEFYARLLTLVQPKTCCLPTRARFLRLLQLSLKSRMLSSTMRAAFIKKMVSVSLLTPSGASLWLLSLALRLLQQGGSTTMKYLILRNLTCAAIESQDPLASSVSSEDDEKQEDLCIHLDDSVPYSKRISGWESNIEDLLATPVENRQDMIHRFSLWELKLLNMHWHTSVMTLSRLFHEDIFKLDAPRLKPDSFLAADISHMLFRELKPLFPKKCQVSDTFPPINTGYLMKESSEQNYVSTIRSATAYHIRSVV